MTWLIPKSCCILKAESLDLPEEITPKLNWLISTNFTLYNLVNIHMYNNTLTGGGQSSKENFHEL